MANAFVCSGTMCEFTDLLFAIDSIPAIFAIAPDDPFIFIFEYFCDFRIAFVVFPFSELYVHVQ